MLAAAASQNSIEEGIVCRQLGLWEGKSPSDSPGTLSHLCVTTQSERDATGNDAAVPVKRPPELDGVLPP